MFFYWDAWNEEHATRHGVSRAESRFVVERAEQGIAERAGDGKTRVWGRTRAGRLIQVVYAELPLDRLDYSNLSPLDLLAIEDGARIVYVVHARDLTGDEKRQFNRRH